MTGTKVFTAALELRNSHLLCLRAKASPTTSGNTDIVKWNTKLNFLQRPSSAARNDLWLRHSTLFRPGVEKPTLVAVSRTVT